MGTVQVTYWVGVKLLGQLLIVLGRERHYRWLLGTHGKQWLGMRCTISREPFIVLVEKGWGWRPATHLVATQLEGNSDINGLIDDTHHRAYQ